MLCAERVNPDGLQAEIYPSDALCPPGDPRVGERLLADCGLLLMRDGYLHLTPQLAELVLLADDEGAAVPLERAVTGTPLEALATVPESELAVQVGALAESVIVDPDRREALVALQRKYDDSERLALGLRGKSSPWRSHAPGCSTLSAPISRPACGD